MIRVERPPEPPEVLQDAGARETRKMCDAYDLHPEEYRSGAKKFTFKDGIYNHRSVKKALVDTQNRKCCYCESKFLGTSWGVVEHFRPKGAVRHGPGRELEYPGYYWLAFHWENLLVSCERCNTIKGSLFPLRDPGSRARCHRDEPGEEEPLLVDPAREDARQHIRFRAAAVEPLTHRGRETIKGMGLEREDLEEERRRKLEIVRTHRDILRCEGRAEGIEEELVAEARRFLRDAVLPQARYSAMVRDFLDSCRGVDGNSEP